MKIERGKQQSPPRLFIYGTEGIGKSSLAASTPAPIFVQTEDGLGQIECDRFPLATSFDEAYQALVDLEKEEHDYQTVVIDSLDWLERLIWDKVCTDFGVKSIEEADGGYAKGYSYAINYWRRVVLALAKLRRNSMLVVLVAHAKIEKFKDPESAAYDRFSPRLHKLASSLITEWCDAVLFATRKFRTEKDGSGFNERTLAKPIGAEGGERILRCVGSPACVAKNRFNLPAELPLSWPVLLKHLTGETDGNT